MWISTKFLDEINISDLRIIFWEIWVREIIGNDINSLVYIE